MKAKIDQAKNSHSNLSIKSKNRVGMPSQSRTVVQAQLETTTPGDAYEQEADRMADMVMRKIDGANTSEAKPSNHCPTPTISCFGGSSMPISSQMESQLQSMQGGGHAMPEGLRAQMEGSFGHDFSNVRLHTDSAAADMSSSINAKAFTHGNDIYFNQGQFQPNTAAGQHLIAHELTHTVQQGGKVAREEIPSELTEKDCEELILTSQLLSENDWNSSLTAEDNTRALISGGAGVVAAIIGGAIGGIPGAAVGAIVGGGGGYLGVKGYDEYNDYDHGEPNKLLHSANRLLSNKEICENAEKKDLEVSDLNEKDRSKLESNTKHLMNNCTSIIEKDIQFVLIEYESGFKQYALVEKYKEKKYEHFYKRKKIIRSAIELDYYKRCQKKVSNLYKITHKYPSYNNGLEYPNNYITLYVDDKKAFYNMTSSEVSDLIKFMNSSRSE